MTQTTVLTILLLGCIGGIAIALLWLRELAIQVQRLDDNLRARMAPVPPQDDGAADRDQLWDASFRPAPTLPIPTKLRRG